MHNPYWPLHSPCPAHLVEGSHQVPQPDWEDPGQDSHPQDYHHNYPTDWVGIFPNLPPEAGWHPPYMPSHQRFQQSNHFRALQSSYSQQISHYFNSATTFNKLDAKDNFWSTHFNEKSSYLTTVNPHKGRYQFLYMPFGLKMFMGQVTDCLPRIIANHDDTFIYSWTPE